MDPCKLVRSSFRSASRRVLTIAPLLGTLALVSGCEGMSDWYREYGDPSARERRLSRISRWDPRCDDEDGLTEGERRLGDGVRFALQWFR